MLFLLCTAACMLTVLDRNGLFCSNSSDIRSLFPEGTASWSASSHHCKSSLSPCSKASSWLSRWWKSWRQIQ